MRYGRINELTSNAIDVTFTVMYTKLFNTIVTSTIWQESLHTKIVWVTMLALSDKNGEVQGSIPGIANLSGVTVDQCEEAIAVLLSPDKYSRSKDLEGRRIEEIPGGWALVNHAKYRAMASKEDEKLKNAARQKRYRDRKVTDSNGGVTDSNGSVTQDRDIADTDTEADTEADTKKGSIGIAKPIPHPGEPGAMEQLWKHTPKRGKERSSFKELDDAWRNTRVAHRPDTDALLAAIGSWSRCEDWTKDGGKFIPGIHLWVKKRKWENLPESASPATPTHHTPAPIEPAADNWREVWAVERPNNTPPGQWSDLRRVDQEFVNKVINES